MIKKTIKKFLTWLNEPHYVDIPVPTVNEDAVLYAELNYRATVLAERRKKWIENAIPYVNALYLKHEGLLPTPKQSAEMANNLFESAKEIGVIDEFNQICIVDR